MTAAHYGSYGWPSSPHWQLYRLCRGAHTARDLYDIRRLLARGASPKMTDGCGYTPLHALAEEGPPQALPAARALLAFGADANARDSQGWTPLHLACRDDRVELVRVLLEHGADPDAQDRRHMTPEDIAVRFACYAAQAVLLDHATREGAKQA